MAHAVARGGGFVRADPVCGNLTCSRDQDLRQPARDRSCRSRVLEPCSL